MRWASPCGNILLTGIWVRRELYVIFESDPVGWDGGPVVRRGVGGAGPSRSHLGGPGRRKLARRLVHHLGSSCAGGAGRLPCPTERELRAHRTGWLLHGHCVVCSSDLGLGGSLGRKRGPRVASIDRAFGRVGGVRALRSGHSTSEGAAALVRGGVHHRLAHHDPLGSLWRKHMAWAHLAGAGLSAVVA